MTDRPSIESLRETLYEIIPPSDPESEHPGRFSDLLAALDELEAYRQMPTLEAAAIARAEKAEAGLLVANRNHEHFEREWYLRGDELEAERARADALAARVEALNEIIRDVSDREGLTDQEYRDWRKLPPIETSLSAHDARVRREALEEAWDRVHALRDNWYRLSRDCSHRFPDLERLKAAILGAAPEGGE